MTHYLKDDQEIVSVHVFSVSAAMVGVCLTVVGIINIITSHLRIKSFADDLTAIGAFIFLCACTISYFAIKTKDQKRRLLLEKLSDAIFLCGLTVLAFICAVLVIALNKVS